MRKQYYFQPSGNGFKAWDVDKLVEKALFQGHNEIKAVRFTEEIPPDYVDVYPDDLPYQTD